MNPISFPLSFGYDDVCILPQKNIVKSRLDVDITSEVIRGVSLAVPLLSANMSTVTNASMCRSLAALGALGVMHRAAADATLVSIAAQLSKEVQWVAMSIGAEAKDYTLAKSLINAGTNIVVIDIANGFSGSAMDLGERLKTEFPHVKIVIGNTTDDSIMFAVDAWADAVKIGISNGFACDTNPATGVNEKEFSSIAKFKEISREIGLPVIADGGIRKSGDFCKAIAGGASSVMIGSGFARCPESAAEEVYIDDKPMKLYAGMASSYVQNQWKGGLKPGTCSEGKVTYLPMGEPVARFVERYAGGLRSSITYSKAKDIKSFQDNVQFARLK